MSNNRERNRLTVVETCTFQEVGNPKPVVADARWSRQCASTEEPYQRRIVVGEEWQRLDLAWLDCQHGIDCGMLVLKNEMKRFANIPSDEEKSEALSAIIEVGFRSQIADIFIPASLGPDGESARFHPVHSHIFLRCQRGSAKVQVSAFPN
jgi:hypothetical protein